MSAVSFWIIGCGNMAGAMLSRWLETGLDPASVQVVDPATPTLPAGVRCLSAIPDDAAPARRVLLGIKPQALDAAAPEIARLVGPDTQLLSMLAGVESGTLASLFPDARVYRLMPNLPVRLGKGVVALYAPQARDAEIDALLGPLGLIEWVEDEDAFHLVTALSGCGPAYLYRFIGALSGAATALGMPAARAARLALATVEGASALAAEAEADPATLADRVASKGGVTREGLNVLDDEGALLRLLEATLAAAERRSRALAKGG